MHQVEIQVVDPKVFQRSIECLRDIVRMMAVVPELSGNEYLIAWNTRILEGFSNSGLRAVDARCVDMAVS